MKSSSQLFPVELVSAEVRGGYFEDLYSLKPNNSNDKSVEIALLRIHSGLSRETDQILFVHDAFRSHWQWMEGQYQKLITKLLAAGFSIWLMDWRAHGSSKKNRQPELNYIEEMSVFDLPAVIAFIEEKTQRKTQLVACGFGAQMVLLGLNALSGVHNLILIDSQSVISQRRYWVPGVKWVKQVKLIGRDYVEGQGSELESSALLKKQLENHGLLSFKRNEQLKLKIKTILTHSDRIQWLCTSKASVKVAKRHSEDPNAIHRIEPSDIADSIWALVSSKVI